MRILLANDGYADAGGVETYLCGIIGGLQSRGHDVALLHHDRCRSSTPYADIPHFGCEEQGIEGALSSASEWRPDVAYSQNMHFLEIERSLLERLRVAKFMHGYFGTCISALKQFAFPAREPCRRRLGMGCLWNYFPRRCGAMSVAALIRDSRQAFEQHALLPRYRAVIVGSEYMRDEFAVHGVPAERLFVNPYFSSARDDEAVPMRSPVNARPHRLLFLGRMTALKGGDLLIRAVAELQIRGLEPLRLVLGGDGPQRREWEALATRLKVDAAFPGWLDEAGRLSAIQNCDLLVMPSVWPEPFGIVGLDAAQQGIPALAFDVGGVREWMIPGVTGWLTEGRRPTVASLANALQAALSDPEQLAERGRKARLRAAELSLETHLHRLEQVLEGVAAQL
jgi:glycosyltransferase involved in cell wall biosynthesis